MAMFQQKTPQKVFVAEVRIRRPHRKTDMRGIFCCVAESWSEAEKRFYLHARDLGTDSDRMITVRPHRPTSSQLEYAALVAPRLDWGYKVTDIAIP